MSELVPFPIGDRTVMVTKQDAIYLSADMHMYGGVFMTLATDGKRYQRVHPADVSIRASARLPPPNPPIGRGK